VNELADEDQVLHKLGRDVRVIKDLLTDSHLDSV